MGSEESKTIFMQESPVINLREEQKTQSFPGHGPSSPKGKNSFGAEIKLRAQLGRT